ncbi:MAG: elongation factor 1-alpha C-terminal domain-related protein, partial [Candidatus Binatia bacterium]
IARVGIKGSQPLVIDSYARNRATGSFILIDEATNNTVAAGMIV